MFLMSWVLKLVNRQGWFTEEIRKDLDVICEIDEAKGNSHLRGLTGRERWAKIVFRKAVKWTLITASLLLFLKILTADVSDGDMDLADRESQFVAAFIYLILAPFLLVISFAIMDLLWRTNLYHSPISREAFVVYEKLGELTYRFINLSILSIALLLYMELFLWSDTSFIMLFWYYIKIITISYSFLTLIPGLMGLFLEHDPRTRLGYTCKASLLMLILVMLPLLLIILGLATVLDSRAIMDQTIYLQIPLILHYLFAFAMVDWFSPLISLGIILSGLGATVYLEHRLLRRDMKKVRLDYKEAEPFFVRKEELLKESAEGMENDAWEETEERDSRKPECKLHERGPGIRVFLPDSRIQSLTPWDPNFSPFLFVFILAAFYIMYLMMPLVAVIIVLMVCSKDSLAGKPFASKFVFLIPEKPEEMADHYHDHIRKKFWHNYLPLGLAAAILVLLPYDFEIGFFEVLIEIHHVPDLKTAAILTTILPFHILSVRLLASGPELGSGEEARGPVRWYSYLIMSYIVLFILYYLCLFWKFSFYQDNFLLCWGFHILPALLAYRVSGTLAGLGLVDRFHGCAISRERIPDIYGLFEKARSSTLTLFVATLLMLGFILYPAPLDFGMQVFGMQVVSESVDPHFEPIPYTTGEIYRSDETVVGEDLVLHKSLVIDARVKFVNCSISFADTRNGALGLFVTERGELILENTTLGSASSFVFEVHSDITVGNSTISGLWGNHGREGGDGGIEIYNVRNDHKAIFWNTSIVGGSSNGIVAWRSNLEIDNCSFSGAGDDPLEISYGRARVENTSFSDCEDGLNIFDARVYLANLTIENCSEGIYMKKSSGEIANSQISYCGDGLYFVRNDIRVTNTTIHHCRNGMMLHNSDPVLTRCTIRDIRKRPIKEDGDSTAKIVDSDIQKWTAPGFEEYLPLWLVHTVILLILLWAARPWKWYKQVKDIEWDSESKKD